MIGGAMDTPRGSGPGLLLVLVLTALGVYALPHTPSASDSADAPLAKDAAARDAAPPAPDEPLETEGYPRLLEEFLAREPKAAGGPDSRSVWARLKELFAKEPNAGAVPKDCLAELVSQSGYDVEFLIATLPDPYESRLGFRFDLLLEAIQRAVETRDYVYDSSWLPWKPPGKHKSEAAGGLHGSRLHEKQPGTVLFRRDADASEGRPRPGLLVLFLVGETPTSGIHKAALVTALRLVAASEGQSSPPRPVRILGPNYSGSQVSLQMALHLWATSLVPSWKMPYQHHAAARLAVLEAFVGARLSLPPVRVYSGSASAIDVEELCDRSLPARVEFKATVHPNEALYSVLTDYIKTHGSKAPALRRKIALLVESNTAYGREELARNEAPQQKETPPTLRLPFPLHIAALRTAYLKNAPANDHSLPALITSGSKLRIPFDDSGPGQRDVISPTAPQMTATANEQVLTHIVTTLLQENVGYVGLIATDPRDKIFLASVVREYCPDVQLFTTEGTLLLAHPEHSYFMRGMLVFSTYPLFARNQQWSGYTHTGEPQQPGEDHTGEPQRRLLFADQDSRAPTTP
jgi:hypothetical protein